VLEFPDEFLKKLEAWDVVKESEAVRHWDTFSNAEFPSEGFWPLIAAESIIENPAEAEANYNETGNEDEDWFETILEKGIKVLAGTLSQLEHQPKSERITARISSIARIDSRFDKFIDPEEGWFVLQSNESTKWTNTAPRNNETWLIDVLGNWRLPTDCAAPPSPLNRVLTMLALATIHDQAARHLGATQDKTCPDVGMQWNVNWERLRNDAFIKSWTKKILASLDRPDETTAVEVLGRGNRHIIVWIPSETAPKLELWNFGETSCSIRFKASMDRIINHHVVGAEDHHVFQKIANIDWTRRNIDEALSELSSNNFVSNNLLILGKNNISSQQLELLGTVERIILETKKQAIRSEASARHVLLNLSGGWNWTYGKIWVPSIIVAKVKRAWMDARSSLALNRKSATKEDVAVNLDSPEWASRIQVLANAENTGRRLEASSLRVRNFETETDAWIATNIWLEGDVSNLETKLKKVRNTEFQIFKRDRVET